VRRVPITVPTWLWITGLALGAVLGTAVLAPTPVPIVVVACALLGSLAVLQVDVLFEWIVAAYWITFCLFSTMLVDQVVAGQFYPFYLAFVIGAIASLVLGGIRIHPTVAWAYVGLMFLHVYSLIGFADPLGSETLDRLIVYPFGALVLLQFRSARGLRPVSFAATASSLAIAVWVIVSAVRGDFAYRGSIDVNQNVVSFYVALGFLIAFATYLQTFRSRHRFWHRIFLFLALGTMAYALVLLASRGMIIATSLALTALMIRAALRDPRKLATFVVVLLLAALGLLLPGGTGILERFEEPGTATGGGRVQIWSVVIEEMAAAGPVDLVFGHGFGASRDAVERRFAPLASTHNAFLQVAFDLGLAGLALFLTLHWHVLARSRSVPDPEGAQMLGLVTFLLAANMFMSTPDGYLYWTTLGFTLALATWGGRRPTNARAAGS